ncbi:MAG TPA: hypothetical protein VG734_06940 [Lacunisphaera sp.]|nr:hypothetical protein [Lacunisphaera sp.]
MRQFLAILLLCVAAVGARAETVKLREQGRLEIYPVGEWKIGAEDVGEIKIIIAPKFAKVNAMATLSITPGAPDEYPTDAKLAKQLTAVAQRLTGTGEFVEKKTPLKTIYNSQGFGCYFMLTDAKLVGKSPVPGDFKKVCLGMLRLSPTVMVKMQILSDGEETEAFQQLLGMVEGMELKGP